MFSKLVKLLINKKWERHLSYKHAGSKFFTEHGISNLVFIKSEHLLDFLNLGDQKKNYNRVLSVNFLEIAKNS